MRHYRPQEGYGTEYKDTGCKFAPSCLNCPFPECLEVEADKSREVGRYFVYPSPKKMARNRAIHMDRLKGKTIPEIATKSGICERTVQRVLKCKIPPSADKTPLGSPTEIAEELSVLAGVR